MRRRRLLPDGTFGPMENVFDDELSPEEQMEKLEAENKLLKARNQALSERADFIEDLIAEIAMQVYQ